MLITEGEVSRIITKATNELDARDLCNALFPDGNSTITVESLIITASKWFGLLCQNDIDF